ncbi:MAG: DUF5678 domain-containing protein [Mycoplasmataceae bacterium]|jgi:hypothetical protein|nr:DUF5678 domain-containing protein [Mycoplasmataceae bacterium]
MNENYKYFKENLQQLLKEYYGKYLVIVDKKVVLSFDTFDLAYKGAFSKYKGTNFIIQKCVNEQDNVANFSNHNVIFAKN